MELKCKARRYLSLFSYKCVSHMTNYVNFKLSKGVEKNPGPTQYNTDHHEVIIRPFIHSSTMQLTSPLSSENLMQSRLGELGLQSIDVGGAGDCLFRSVSQQLYGNSNHHMRIRIAGVQFMRDNPERFIESNTENSWLRYLSNMCIHSTWADALIQAVADVLKVTIQIVESNQGFAPLITVYTVQERNFVYNYYMMLSHQEISILLCPYMQFVSLSSNHALTGILQHYRLSMNMHVCSMRSVM